MSEPDYIIPTSAARTVMPVSTFHGKDDTEATITRLLSRALDATKAADE